MELKLEQSNGKYLYRILCVLTVIVASLPVACNYIMSGGVVTEWVSQVKTLTMEPLRLFPSAGINSNLWCLFPSLLYKQSGNMALAYRVNILFIQVLTLLFSKLFFEECFSDDNTKFMAFFGILLYMTCPYRIYVCYDLADLSAATVWMLLPLYAWAVLQLVRKSLPWRALVVAAFSLAGVGYANAVYFVILSGLTLLTALCCKKVLPLAGIAAGAVFFLPGLHRLGQYLTSDIYQAADLPVQTIMKNGYRVGWFFSTYAYRNGHPGMGLGMLICLVAGLWLWFVNGNEWAKKFRFSLGLAIFLMLLSLRCFPWDLAQRLGTWSLKLVSLMNTPAIFGGLAFACLCIPAAGATGRIARYGNKIISFVIPVLVLVTCIAVCVYQCNMLTFSRLPLENL